MTSVQPPWDDATQPRENWALYSSPVVCCAASCCTGNIEYYNQSNSLESSRSYPIRASQRCTSPQLVPSTRDSIS
ncbi:hypothetical protein HBH56_170050 [Parastagonospora nodorum]|nr:hypothetical protein HBH56_170050 [Parastagonospora nodorum]KAH3928577.1 hypothetical protein HBH54_138600 [Parastagonospora nodorum]KAH3945498.1 hypothetical protein HBH53_143950 [Parastagonospora nodorum]KAH4029081.1 hypothetical protein HBI13_044100 [Parastagonospora nodorum]KAH4037973.1 hypothetical protein HBI09_061280 [Parastagonospora nodorum]